MDAEKGIPEGGAVKPRESGLASEVRAAGAPQAAGDEAHAAPQNQAPTGSTAAEAEGAKADAPAPYKEDDKAAPGGEPQKQKELGARGVPLGDKKSDDRPDVAEHDQAQQVKVEDKSIEKKKEMSENHIENVGKDKLDEEVKEKVVKEQELERERGERLALQQQLEKDEKERIRKEVLARVEKERLEREKREEQERKEAQLAQELQRTDSEINERAQKVLQAEETQERLAALHRAVEAKITEEAVQGGEGKPLKNGGRDLKEQAAAQADPREGLEENEAIKAEPRPQSSSEKGREQEDMDLKRRRRALGPREAAGPPEDSAGPRGVPRLEPLLELGGSDLHAALEQQLLAGAVVHSRQMKQTKENDDGTK